MALDRAFWRARRVFVTGHTGFKGAWLCEMLHALGAHVSGYALAPPTQPALFEVLGLASRIDRHHVADIADLDALRSELLASEPDVVLHLAAQPLVRRSYLEPLPTLRTNILGTAHLLEAARALRKPCALVIVTTDKCYENHEQPIPYREGEALGGADPYSASKACAEIVSAAYRKSFFSGSAVRVATARAGNVIGGGDWSEDRLIPDAWRAFTRGQPLKIRFPDAVRPWQHVLEPLAGYLDLAQRLSARDGERFAEAWNFGPDLEDCRPVRWLIDRVCELWGDGATWSTDASPRPHESTLLTLDCSKAHTRLGWRAKLDLATAVSMTVQWYRSHLRGEDMARLTLDQVHAYLSLLK